MSRHSPADRTVPLRGLVIHRLPSTAHPQAYIYIYVMLVRIHIESTAGPPRCLDNRLFPNTTVEVHAYMSTNPLAAHTSQPPRWLDAYRVNVAARSALEAGERFVSILPPRGTMSSRST